MNLVLWKSLSPLSSKHNQACPPLCFSKAWCLLSALFTVMLWLIRQGSLLIYLNLFAVCTTITVYRSTYITEQIFICICDTFFLMSSTTHGLFTLVWYSHISRLVQNLNFYLRLNYAEMTDDRVMLNLSFCGKTCCHMEYSCSPRSLIRLIEWTQTHRVILAQWV